MRKQIPVMTILTLIFFLLASPVLAEPVKPDSAGSNSNVGPQAMTMLREGSTTMGAAGTGLLAISLSTYAYHTVNEVGVDATLQQWDGSDWVDVRTYPFVKYNASSISKTIAVSVQREYSYRLIGKHYCSSGAVYESLYTVTSGIYVD